MKKQFLIYCILFATPVALFGARGGEAAPVATSSPTPTPPPSGGGVPTATSSVKYFNGISDVVQQANNAGKLNEVIQGAVETLKYTPNANVAKGAGTWHHVGVQLASGTAATAIATLATGAASSSKRLGRLGNGRR